MLLSAYRLAERALWQFITDRLAAEKLSAGVRSAVLTHFWSHASHWFDATVELLADAFTAEQAQWQGGALARRNETVNTILAGQESVDIDIASTTLSYPLRQHHTAWTLWVDEDVRDADVPVLLDTAALAVSGGIGAGGLLTTSSGARSLWCWSASPVPPEALPRADVISVLPQSVRMTIATSHPGLDGFRLSHAEAVAALNVGHLTGATVTRYCDVELACLATGISGESALEAFVKRELGELAAAGETTVRLRETLRIYLEQACDTKHTAEIQNLHPNTVRYRLRQAEKKIGRPINHRRIHLALALEIVGVLGVAPKMGGLCSRRFMFPKHNPPP